MNIPPVLKYGLCEGLIKNTHWINPPTNIEDYQGMIYIITNKTTQRFYIGKKTFWNKNRKKLSRKPLKTESDRIKKYTKAIKLAKLNRPLKHRISNAEKKAIIKLKEYKTKVRNRLQGIKTVSVCRRESDWRNYTGSSEELNTDIEKLGIGNFEFKILELCKSKWELSYIEAKYQFKYDVLRNDKAYNHWICIKSYEQKK